MLRSTPEHYLLDRCDPSGGPDACWPWLLSTGSHGYGNAWDGSTVVLAHRFAYETWIGPIPEELTVDHGCRNPICINPVHLRLRTNEDNGGDNVIANRLRAATHCKRGHRFDEANTYVDPAGRRHCRACRRELRRLGRWS